MTIGHHQTLGYDQNPHDSTSHSLTVWLAISLSVTVVLIISGSLLTRVFIKREKARRRQRLLAQDAENCIEQTPEEKEARRLKRMERLDNEHPAIILQEWIEKQVSEKETSEVECSICLKSIAPDTYIRQLDCNHCFHQPCVDEWVGGGHDACPLCRGIILTALLKWPIIRPVHVRERRQSEISECEDMSHASPSNAGLS